MKKLARQDGRKESILNIASHLLSIGDSIEEILVTTGLIREKVEGLLGT